MPIDWSRKLTQRINRILARSGKSPCSLTIWSQKKNCLSTSLTWSSSLSGGHIGMYPQGWRKAALRDSSESKQRNSTGRPPPPLKSCLGWWAFPSGWYCSWASQGTLLGCVPPALLRSTLKSTSSSPTPCSGGSTMHTQYLVHMSVHTRHMCMHTHAHTLFP